MKRGYRSMFDYYFGVNPTINEPLYTRPAWPAMIEAEGYSSVSGAPHRLQAEVLFDARPLFH